MWDSSQLRSVKNRVKAIGLVALALALAATLTACGGDSNGGGDDGDFKYTVGYSMPTGAQPIQQNVAASLAAAGERIGVKVVTLDAQLDANKQVSDIDQFVAQQVDGIIVFPLSEDSLEPPLNRAREAGIKILGMNAIMDPEQTDIDPFDANFDQGEMITGAKLSAEYMAEALDGEGKVLGIDIGFPVPSLNEMVNNYRDFLAEAAPNTSWLATIDNTTDDIAGGESAVTEAIAKFRGEIDGILAYNTLSGLGAAAAFQSAGLDRPVIVAANGDPEAVEAIQDGRIDASLDIVPWREALVGMTIMHRLLEGKDVPRWIETPNEFYTVDNLDERVDWDEAVELIRSGELTCENGGCPQELLG